MSLYSGGDQQTGTVDPSRVPAHVAIIMDGNGRWATQKGLPRTAGHNEGLVAAKRIVKAASELGIKYLTLFTFSTENWKRASSEVVFLMQLIRFHLRKESAFYRENRIRVVHSGDFERLPRGVQREISTVVDETKAFNGMTLNLAINYGGRDEIVRAVNRWLAAHAPESGRPPLLTERALREALDCVELPDPDLVIRTAGEQRMSNFLLWQAAYAELYFTSKLWPEFCPEDLSAAIAAYERRTRTFGSTPVESDKPSLSSIAAIAAALHAPS